MKTCTWFTGMVLALGALLATAPPVSAQSVTAAEVQRLQDAVLDASRDVAALRTSDAALASTLDTQLDEIRDDVAYLRGKLRREGSLSTGRVRPGAPAHRRPARRGARPRLHRLPPPGWPT